MKNDTINLTEAREYIVNLTLQAGKTLKKYFTSGKFTSKSKGGVDFLTQADEEVDHFLRESIEKRYPQTEFLTEETAPLDYSKFKDVDNLWVIDPLDGTVNFSRGNSHFAISIALVDKGVSKLGVVYAPVVENMYWAQVDKDAAFLDGNPIKVSITDNMKETVLACDWAWNLEKRLRVVSWLGKICTEVRQIKCMGSAVSDLASLAEGKIDAYLNSGLKPWDVAAGALFIEKAGGKITTPQGETWDVFCSDMLASNGVLHGDLLDLINR